ncbi:uncharacterized protein LOC126769960 [Nymphalis io]|uniref:uncharacterized protein LOC126769960 n=1 Tax=Inachis io TaxID=171585 RepID=UPI002167371F|nr:uncharacterized protein LOC126769960 [Nymphalis io]
MNYDDFKKPYKQRFKGVENFLRRIAFNLGNTASQTEVKIISCIPIDVTDLQQKIISLEKQLQAANGQTPNAAVPPVPTENAPDKPNAPENVPNKEKPSTVVNLAPFESGFAKKSSTVSYCSSRPTDKVRSSQVGSYCEECSSRNRKSNVSFVFPALTTSDTKNQCKFGIRENCNNDSAAAIDCYRNIFRKRKRKKNYKGNNKIKTHLVYYAQHTAENPFKIIDNSLKYNDSVSSNDELCKSYLNKIMRRQYDPNEVKEFSDTSHFSRPICRDVDNSHTNISKYESGSDICSCCHDKFRNIDYYMTKGDYDSIITKIHNSVDNTNAFYDSNHYDVIPVKENSNKTLKNNNEQKIENEMNVEIKCWAGHLRTKHKRHSYFYNYQGEIPIKRRPNKILQDMLLIKTNQSSKSIKKKEKTKVLNNQIGCVTSKSFCIYCSDVYPKHSRQAKPRKFENLKTILQKHESVATDEEVHKLQVNNQSTQLDINKVDDYRELTLKQIKSILQSVLEEVKIDTKINTPNEVIKKDVVVQKGASHNSMAGDSTFLRSYNYNNSYNTNPHLASCSKQTPLGQYCVPGIPCQHLKCLQNFPVFIQSTPGRHMCSCYCEKSSYKSHARQAITAATNTNKEPISSSSETEKLIKEIYKSMAINMDFPTKDSSKSECNDLKPPDNEVSNTIEVKNVGVLNKRDFKVDAEVSPIQSYLNKTKMEYESIGAQSDDTRQTIHLNNSGRYNKKERLEFHSVHSSDTIVEVENESDESSDESDSDETLILEEEYKQDTKTKKGFFNRMLKSVNLFKKKKSMPAEKEASDSDDYETIYSEKSAKVSPKVYKKVKTVVPYDRARTKRSPYMEQEYRRHWNEGIAFREQRENICSSERPNLTNSNPIRTRPLYWTDIEARSAFVDHNMPYQCRINDATSHVEEGMSPQNVVQKGGNKERLGWLKKHKLGINCGEQWKKFILES